MHFWLVSPGLGQSRNFVLPFADSVGQFLRLTKLVVDVSLCPACCWLSLSVSLLSFGSFGSVVLAFFGPLENKQSFGWVSVVPCSVGVLWLLLLLLEPEQCGWIRFLLSLGDVL